MEKPTPAAASARAERHARYRPPKKRQRVRPFFGRAANRKRKALANRRIAERRSRKK